MNKFRTYILILLCITFVPSLVLGQSPGSKKWTYETEGGQDWGAVNSTATIGSDGTIYVGSDDNNLYAINPDGSKKWNFKTSGDVYSSPAIGSDGTIYIGTYDGVLQAVNGNNIISHRQIKITSFNNHAAPFSLTFETESDSTYVIEASHDLMKWGEIGEVQATGSSVEFTDWREALFEKQYFRVKLVE